MAVLAVGILLTAIAGWITFQYYGRVESERAALKTDNAASAVQLAMDRVALAVRAVRAIYAADWVTRDQFTRFAGTLVANESLQSLAFYRRVRNDDRASYEATLGGDPAATLGIWEWDDNGEPVRAPERAEYYVIESDYVTGSINPMIGFDAASLPGRRETIEQAISRFGLVASGVVGLETGRDGVVFYVPAVDRTGSVIGVATGTVTLQQLAATGSRASGAFGIRIAADDPPSETADDAATASPVDATRRSFDFGGKTWTITVPRNQGTDPTDAWLVLLVIGAGLATTVAVVAYMIGLTKTAEATEARRRLRRMLDSLGPLAWLLDSDGTVVYANRTAAEALGRGEDDMSGRPFWDVLLSNRDPAGVDSIRSAVMRAAKGDDVRFDHAIERDDDVNQILDLWIRPLGVAEGSPADLVASAVDVTGRFEVEQTLRLLMRELDHRMKNTLQVVQAIIRRTARAQGSVERFEAALLGRVGAMARAHEVLARERWLGAAIDTIVKQEVASFDVGSAIKHGGPSVRLNPKAALSIALVIHELGTNASKYGALSTATGTISVEWRIDRTGAEPSLVLEWRESGGPNVSAPDSGGFGSMLIERSIAYELEGNAIIDYRSDGLVCTISIPVRTIRPFVTEPTIVEREAEQA